jgi:hypothetical protein
LAVVAKALTVLLALLPALQALPAPVWVAMTFVSLCAWALIVSELRPRREQTAPREDVAAAGDTLDIARVS